jgi:hypothetical protein
MNSTLADGNNNDNGDNHDRDDDNGPTLPPEVWHVILLKVARRSLADCLSVTLTCTTFHAIVIRCGDRLWRQYARLHGICLLPKTAAAIYDNRSARAALRDRSNFVRHRAATSGNASFVCRLADIFARQSSIAVDQSTLARRRDFDFGALAVHLWSSAHHEMNPILWVTHDWMAANMARVIRTTFPPARPYGFSWAQPTQRVVAIEQRHAPDTAILMTARHMGAVYFFDYARHHTPAWTGNTDAVIVDGFGRDFRDLCSTVNRILSKIRRREPFSCGSVDALARLCCDREAAIIILNAVVGDSGDTEPSVALIPIYYGALSLDDPLSVWSVRE